MSNLEKAKELEKVNDTIDHKEKLVEMSINRGMSTWSDTYDLKKAEEKAAELKKELESQ